MGRGRSAAVTAAPSSSRLEYDPPRRTVWAGKIDKENMALMGEVGVRRIWVVVPAFNEAENLGELVPRILAQASALHPDSRVLVVDDGSTDATAAVMGAICSRLAGVEFLRLARQRGKAAALQRGFRHALDQQAQVVVMMDADGQDEPAELPRLLEQLDAGFDLVTGARLARRDLLVKRLTSRLFNRATRVLTGVPGTDLNSGFKVMSAAVASDLSPMLYGEMHRYITVMAHWLGYRITEVPVTHRERRYGQTKYSVARFWRGFLDLLTVRFLMSYARRPSHLFGGIGIISLLLGMAGVGVLGWSSGNGPSLDGPGWWPAALMLLVAGVLLVFMGLLAELIVFTRPPRGDAPAGAVQRDS